MMNLDRSKSGLHFKSAQIDGLTLETSDLDKINAYTLSPLVEEDIFAFKVAMANNEVDRDYEVFPRDTLAQLANLFVGKTVVKDHVHRSDNQIARIYATELVESRLDAYTSTGEIYTQLVAKCYMVKTSNNADLIAEIQAGIRKEVSLGCHIGKATCSICGTDNVQTYCSHFGGQSYEGRLCHFKLGSPKDAYELSFVAVPAQREAGTVKAYGEKPCHLQEYIEAQKQKTEEAKAITSFEAAAPDENDEQPSDSPEIEPPIEEEETEATESPSEQSEGTEDVTSDEQDGEPEEAEELEEEAEEESRPEEQQAEANPEAASQADEEKRLTVNRFEEAQKEAVVQTRLRLLDLALINMKQNN